MSIVYGVTDEKLRKSYDMSADELEDLNDNEEMSFPTIMAIDLAIVVLRAPFPAASAWRTDEPPSGVGLLFQTRVTVKYGVWDKEYKEYIIIETGRRIRAKEVIAYAIINPYEASI